MKNKNQELTERFDKVIVSVIAFGTEERIYRFIKKFCEFVRNDGLYNVEGERNLFEVSGEVLHNVLFSPGTTWGNIEYSGMLEKYLKKYSDDKSIVECFEAKDNKRIKTEINRNVKDKLDKIMFDSCLEVFKRKYPNADYAWLEYRDED